MPGNLVLVGYMGSGKTTVGALVARELGLRFIDLDDVIEDGAGISIQEIFRSAGEARFRELEAAALEQVLTGEGTVLATGGGAPMQEDSWRLIMRENMVVHLDASTDALLDRVGMGEGRPMLAAGEGDPDAFKEQLIRIFEKRRARYLQAPHRVDTTGRGIKEVAAEVAALARSAGLGAADEPSAGDGGGAGG